MPVISTLLFIVLPLFVVSHRILTSVRFKELYSRIPALLLSTMKCLILVAILLSVGLAHGYNCPEEGIHFDDNTIDCNMTVESWEDCGMFHDNQSCWHRFGLLSLRHNSYCHLLKFLKKAGILYFRPNQMGREVLEGLRASQSQQRPLSKKINKLIITLLRPQTQTYYTFH